MYFKRFQNILYPFNIKGKEEFKVVTDITRNVRVIKEIAANITLYDLYDIVDGDTPEIISEKFYGTPDYHWVIMILNDRYDYITDFPLPQYELEQFIIQKYGEDQVYADHHYVLNGLVVMPSTPGATPVSNQQYEYEQNEKKRTLKMVSSEVMGTIIKQFEAII
jgi:hypothetical protein